mmetsp:Transcript_32614/g.97431  ORF Transcript_32614/g.97431 Transcript_32614/m.97431 type:complete len:253 (-) Transcript_32614:524-1282(-)
MRPPELTVEDETIATAALGVGTGIVPALIPPSPAGATSTSSGTSANGGTGNRWWKLLARCGASTSFRPHTAQSVGNSEALALQRGQRYPVLAKSFLSRVACISVGTADDSRVGNPILTKSHRFMRLPLPPLSPPSLSPSPGREGGGTHCPMTRSRRCSRSMHTPTTPPVSSAILRQTCISAARATQLTRTPAARRRGRVSTRTSPGSHVDRAPAKTSTSLDPWRGTWPRDRPATSKPFCRLNSPPSFPDAID